MSVPPDAKSILSEVERIAESAQFVRSRRLTRFLRFTVAETLEGRADALSEHVIATEAYERPTKFDPQLDPIIRNEARRLRSKLNRYYRTDGVRDPIILRYRPGSYAPSFHARADWQSLDFLDQAGKLGGLIAAFDWKNTSLGAISIWPTSLKYTLDICLRSKIPMSIHWGPDLVFLYNDAEAAMLGDLHPSALGQPTSSGLKKVWEQIGPNLLGVLRTGESIEAINHRVVLNRRGYDEECYFTFSCSAVPDDNGVPSGVLVVTTETTDSVVKGRRRSALWELASRLWDVDTVEEVCRLAAHVLSTDSFDVPFAWIYRMVDSSRARLEAAAGHSSLSSLCPFLLQPASDSSSLAIAMRTMLETIGTPDSEILEVQSLRVFLPGHASLSAQSTVVLAIPGWDTPIFGFLVVAASRQRSQDPPYRSFLKLAATQIANVVRKTREREQDRERAASLATVEAAQRTFLVSAVQQLNRPLVALNDALQGLASSDDAALNSCGRQVIENAHWNYLLLSKSVHSLQLLTRLKQSANEIVLQPVDISAVTAELADLFRPAIEKAGLSFKVECPPMTRVVYFNLEVWETVLATLLSNAFRFTEKGEIGVATNEIGTIIKVMIWDTGQGIVADDLPFVFDPFHRFTAKPSRSAHGAGVGLPVIRELLSVNGATIRADSKAHYGSTFTVTIPSMDRQEASESAIARSSSIQWSVAQVYAREVLQWSEPGSQPLTSGMRQRETLAGNLELPQPKFAGA